MSALSNYFKHIYGAILLPRSCTSMKILEIYDISCLVLDQNLKNETKFLTVSNFERSKIELPQYKPKIEICTHPNPPKNLELRIQKLGSTHR